MIPADIDIHRVATVHPGPLVKRFGEHQRLVQLEEKLGCTACGNRFGNYAIVFRLDRSI
jgi:hypothetical protein